MGRGFLGKVGNRPLRKRQNISSVESPSRGASMTLTLEGVPPLKQKRKQLGGKGPVNLQKDCL